MPNLELHASTLTSFMACPRRYHLAHVAGVVPAETSDALRKGTVWHGLFEACKDSEDFESAVVEYIDSIYRQADSHYNAEKQDVERYTLIALALCHRWHHGPGPVTHVEVKFNTPSGVPGVRIVGTADGLGRDEQGPFILERKTTSRPANDPEYWASLRLRTQTLLYVSTLRDLQADGKLVSFGIMPYHPPIRIIYDVTRKPSIRPKSITKADLARLAASGEYCGATFPPDAVPDDGRETPRLFAARLMQDIAENPSLWFARREVAITDRDLGAFRIKLNQLIAAVKSAHETESWWQNEQSCESPFRCAYRSMCYHGYTADSDPLPPGFVRLTVEQNTHSAFSSE